MTEAQHTLLPWEVCNGIDIYPVGDTEARHYVANCDPDGASLECMTLAKGEHPHTDSTFEMKRADAAFIVAACNSYYANQAEIARLRAGLKAISELDGRSKAEFGGLLKRARHIAKCLLEETATHA